MLIAGSVESRGQGGIGTLRLMGSVVVVVGGPGRPVAVSVPEGAVVIAADGGLEVARELGIAVDVVVGDFDSVAEDALEGVGRVERHPVVKDASDLELALAVALRLEPERILVVGGGGGRLDHLFGSVLLLGSEAYARVQLDALLGEAVVHVVRGERLLVGAAGELVSLFALHGPASGVVTEGLVYRLRGETLKPGSSRGLSNVFVGGEARIRVGDGVLLVVRPTGSDGAGS
jgi:thiamine pyrophosphokinase